jgi:multiple sugar transport system permease protein
VRYWRRGPRWREAVDGWLFILPWLLGFLFFTAGPMAASAVMSFLDWEILTPPTWVGLANFRQLALDPLFGLVLYNTAFYTFLGVPLYLLAALIMALLLNLPLRGIPIYRTIYFMPSLTPAVANALLWVWIFSPDFGLANYFLGLVGLPPQKWLFDVNLAKPALILMGLWGVALYEAASIDGANEWRRFWSVTLPMLSPTIFFNLVIGIIGSFQVFTTAYIATQGGPQNATLFYVLYLWRNGFDYFKMGYASALAWVLLLIVLLLTLIQFRLARRLVYYEVEEPA